MEFFILQQLGIAAVLGCLIGIEREKSSQSAKNDIFLGGIRTFTLIAVFGALAYMISEISVAVFIVFCAGFLGLIIASYIMTNLPLKRLGATTEIAAILVFLIGILCGMEKYLIATSVTLFMAVLLQFRETLHLWVSKINEKEILSAIEFILIAFVVLPLLPNEWYGIYDFFNPYVIWLMVVFISGISFVSYVLIKLFGADKGITFTGFLAGLISSTALVLSFSEQSKKNSSILYPFVVAVVIASGAMFFRVLFVVFVLNEALFFKLSIPLGIMGVVGVGFAFYYFQKGKKTMQTFKTKPMHLESPFSLKPAIKFGLVFGLILFLVKFAQIHLGDAGLYITSVVSGIMDVDAITVSVATFANDESLMNASVIAILLATIVNTISKGVMFFVFGERKVAIKIAIVFMFMIIAGAGSLLLVL